MNRPNNKENKKRFNKDTQPSQSPQKRTKRESSKVSKKNYEKEIRTPHASDKRTTKESSTSFKEFRTKGSKPSGLTQKRTTKKTSAEYKEFDKKVIKSSRFPRKRATDVPSKELKSRDESGSKPEWVPRKRAPRKSSIEFKQVDENETRLNKYLASTGLCSRREADELIKSGLITINGELVTELGMKVKKGDDIRYNGERLKTERLVYILLNKPKDYVTTVRDNHAKRTVMDLVQKACRERVYPVGRLDKNTTGVLLFTNDGDLAKKLTHPSYNKLKIYHVSLDKSLTRADFRQILEGIELEDGFIKADALNFTDPKSMKEVGIEIHSGRNHIVRRIFEHFEYKVKKLDRVYFAGLTKKGLERGKYRFLNETEIAMLKMGSYK